MVLHVSSFTMTAVAVFPAKIQSSHGAVLSTSCVILRPPSTFSLLPYSQVLIPSRMSPVPPNPKASPRQQYVYSDPIPEFAVAETRKFKAELLKELSKEKGTFGNDLNTVLDTCAEIFCEFLHKEYGGPGTLLVEPFTDMLIVLKEKKLPGAPVAARASLLWAQNYVDQDWEIWNSKPPERF